MLSLFTRTSPSSCDIVARIRPATVIGVVTALTLLLCFAPSAKAQVKIFGDVDALGFGYGNFDPFANTTLNGLSSNATTFGNHFAHTYPFDPESDEFAGTDQIYVGSVQTGVSDGYSSYAGRKNGPLTTTLDYSSLIPSNVPVLTLTLGISADDFQFPRLNQPFTASINGTFSSELTNVLNTIDGTGPQVQFFTLGLDPSTYVNVNRTLIISIDNAGTGGDGFAVDFFTVGVTFAPEPSALALLLPGLMIGAGIVRRKKRG